MKAILLTMALLAAVALAGCDRGVRPPATDMPDSLLVRALSEAHIAVARAATTGEDVDSLRLAAFEASGIDPAGVDRALDAYAARPAALSALYDRVADDLRQQQEAMDERIRLGPRED